MPAAADLSLLNNAAVAVTFNVYSVEPDSVHWTESGATSILGTSRARLSRKIPTNPSSGVYRVQGRVTRPVVNVTSGALDGTVTMNFEILRPANLSIAEVNECYARFKAFVALAIIKTSGESGAIPT